MNEPEIKNINTAAADLLDAIILVEKSCHSADVSIYLEAMRDGVQALRDLYLDQKQKSE